MVEGRVTQQYIDILREPVSGEVRVTQDYVDVLRHDTNFIDRFCSDVDWWTERHYPGDIAISWNSEEFAECSYEMFCDVGINNEWRFISFDKVGNRIYDFDILSVVRQDEAVGVAGDDIGVGLAARYSGEAGSADGYMLSLVENNAKTRRYASLRKIVSGSTTELDHYPPSGEEWERWDTANDWYYLRLQVEGSVQKGKIWHIADEEPDSWQMEASDTAVVGPGYCGLTFYTAYQDAGISYYAVGVDGAEPPDLILPRAAQVTSSPLEVLRKGKSEAEVTQYCLQVLRYHEIDPVEIQLQELALSGEAQSMTVKITLDTQTTMKIPCTM